MDNYPDIQASPRDRLLGLYQQALKAVQGRGCVAGHLLKHPLKGRVWCVALGKAAASMLEGADAVLQVERALLITKPGYAPVRVPAGTELVESGHPLPDAASLAAGQGLLRFMAEAPPDIHWLFLISGGASSLVEVLPGGVTLDDLQRATQWLLASGLPIEQMNAVRRRLSRIKGGQLCSYLRGRPARVLSISDVPGDDPCIIGSGPLAAARGEWPLPAGLPDWLRVLLDTVPVAPPADCSTVETHIVADLDQALVAAAEHARGLGMQVHLQTERLAGDATAVGERLAAQLLEADAGIYLWGGETTVILPEQPGQGGRCQQLALAAAARFAGERRITLLAAGSDGSDGPGEVAGACVDGDTLGRGQRAGLDARRALAAADAGRFLEAAGDLIETGPTGTNVTDLVMALKTE